MSECGSTLRVALEVVAVATEEPYRLGCRKRAAGFSITESPNVLPRNLVSHRLPSDKVGSQSPCSESDFVANVIVVADDNLRTLQMRLIHRADRAVSPWL